MAFVRLDRSVYRFSKGTVCVVRKRNAEISKPVGKTTIVSGFARVESGSTGRICSTAWRTGRAGLYEWGVACRLTY
jgi:hypothetical protein